MTVATSSPPTSAPDNPILRSLDQLPRPELLLDLLDLYLDERVVPADLCRALAESPRLEIGSIARCAAQCGESAPSASAAWILAGATHEVLEPSNDQVQIDWTQAVTAAILAAQLARACGADERQALVAGLLHDLGKFALASVAPRSDARIAEERRSHDTSIIESERAVLGLDHTAAGRYLATRWRLPQAVRDVCWFHHHRPDALPRGAGHGALVRLVIIADARLFGNDEAECAARSDLGLTEEAVQHAVVALQSELSAWAQTESNTAPAAADAPRGAIDCLDAFRHLHEHLPAAASFGEACSAAAASLSLALGSPAVVVCESAEPNLWYAGYEAAGKHNSEALEWNPQRLDFEDRRAARALSTSGVWVSPLPESWSWAAERYAGICGQGVAHWLPLLRDGSWVGAAIFAATDDVRRRLEAESDALQLLSTAVATVLGEARARVSAERLSEALADVSARWSSVQDELARSRSMSVIAEAASGAAHELNTPLAIISGRAQLLHTQTRNDAARAVLATIIEQAQRCTQIISELEALSDPPVPVRESIPLAAYLSPLRDEWIAANKFTPESLEIELSDDVAPAHADPSHVRQILNELLQNALDATDPAQRRLTIKAWHRPTDETVVIQLADNGRGMTPDVRKRAFDPFFSARPAGRGRGLGLTRALSLARVNGGTLRIDARESGGTLVDLVLPAARA